MQLAWTFQDQDRLLAEELAAFVPDEIYDMHMHVYRRQDLREPENQLIAEGPEEADLAAIADFYGRLLPESRFRGGLAIGYPTYAGDRRAMNQYVAAQVAGRPDCRGSICIAPDDRVEDITDFLDRHPAVIGIKPYHIYSASQPTWHAGPQDYLPEWAWRIADERRLIITLHLVKEAAIADPENQNEIRRMCEKYPAAKLVLAHAARCFHAPNARKGLAALLGLDNVWFDLSAICESEPLQEILDRYGPQRLLWGSDFPVCLIRGRAVTLGLDFIWLQADTINWQNLGMPCRPVLVGLESLRALQTACLNRGLTRAAVKAIFCGNARFMLGLSNLPVKVPLI